MILGRAVTGRELKNFAEENGLLIPPYRDFDEWAKLVSAKGGQCPCNQEKMCPCQDAITEINEAPTDDLACCTCRFYCSERYINHWSDSWRAQGLIAKKELPKEKRELKNEEIIQIINSLTRTKSKLEKEDPDSATDILQNEAEGNHCEACRSFMEAEAARAMFLSLENKIDVNAYKIDAKRAIDRIDELILLYEQVDESLDTDKVETPKKGDLSDTHRDGYHECLSKALNHPTLKARVPASQDRFKVANIFCRGKAATLTQAIEFFEESKT
jgi:hypothetical protein